MNFFGDRYDFSLGERNWRGSCLANPERTVSALLSPFSLEELNHVPRDTPPDEV